MGSYERSGAQPGTASQHAGEWALSWLSSCSNQHAQQHAQGGGLLQAETLEQIAGLVVECCLEECMRRMARVVSTAWSNI